MDRLVFGDTIRHPITGYPISRSVSSTDHQALTPNQEARQIHLPMILREHGKAVHDRIKAELDEHERNHGEPALPSESLPVGFEHALRKG